MSTAQRRQNDGAQQGCQVYQNGVRCGETKTLTIIQEFKQLYEDKMRIIDQEGSGDCGVQAKISLQQDWIRDLTEQNEMLVRAVEELEQEATERVLSLEEKLKQSSKCACETIKVLEDKERKIADLEKQIDIILKRSNECQDSSKDREICALKQRYRSATDCLNKLRDKSCTDACNQTTYICTEKLINNLTRKCAQVRSNLELYVCPRRIARNTQPCDSIPSCSASNKSLVSCKTICPKIVSDDSGIYFRKIISGSHIAKRDACCNTETRLIRKVSRDKWCNTDRAYGRKIMCNASTATATRTSSVLRFRETQTNTEPRIILELTDSGTNTVIMFRRKDAYTNTGPRIVLKQKHTSCNTDFCENIERRPRGRVLYLNDEPGVSEISIYASTLSLVPEERREVARNRCRDAEEKRKEVARNKCYVENCRCAEEIRKAVARNKFYDENCRCAEEIRKEVARNKFYDENCRCAEEIRKEVTPNKFYIENCRCAEEKRKEPENVPCRCPKTNVVHENYYVQAPANKTKCIPYLYKTDRAASSYTCLDEEEPMAFRGRMDGKRYKPTKIPMPVRYLPTGRTENARMRHHLRDSCCSLERDAHCYYCPGFVSFRPNKIKVLPSPLNNLDTLYRHPVYPKHYDYDYNRKYNAMPETSRVHQGKDGQTRSDSSDGIERNVGYFSCCRGFISHRPRKFKVLPSARDNLDTLYRHPMYLGKRYFGNEDKYDPQYETFKQGIKPESVNIVDPKDTTVQRFESLGRGNKSQYGKQSKKIFHSKNVIPYTENEDLNKTILPSSSQNYFLEDDSVESTDKPLTRQIGSSTIPTVESFNSSAPLKSKPILKTRTSSISKTIDWDDKLVSSNKPKTPRKSSADEEEFVKFYANVTQASSKDSVLNVQGSPPEDINTTHAGSFYEDQNVNLNYTLRGGEINFRTVQESIENETFPEEYKQIEETSPGENKITEVLLMNQQIVELIEEVFDKEKQIANMQDLLSFTVKTLMTVLASLNAVEKKTTRILITARMGSCDQKEFSKICFEFYNYIKNLRKETNNALISKNNSFFCHYL